MIDTHSHIYDPAFDEDRDEAIARAKESGVTKLLLPNVDVNTIQPMVQLASQHREYMACAMGLHPTEVRETWQDDLAIIKSELFNKYREAKHAPSLQWVAEGITYWAIGEIGIDLYWDRTFIEEQKQVFRQQMLWALDLDLPVILHIRKAHAEIFEVLASLRHDRFKGVFHCFGGGIEEARKAVSLGFMLGIGGVVTYKNSGLPEIIKEIGLDHIVTETDDPYLPPVPFRGKRNEPSFMKYVVDRLAGIFDENASLVDEITTFNARKTFNI